MSYIRALEPSEKKQQIYIKLNVVFNFIDSFKWKFFEFYTFLEILDHWLISTIGQVSFHDRNCGTLIKANKTCLSMYPRWLTSSRNCDTRHLGWNLSSISTVPFLGARAISRSGHMTTVPGSTRVGSEKLVKREKVAGARLWFTMCTLLFDTCPILIAPKLHTLFLVPVTSNYNTTLLTVHKNLLCVKHYGKLSQMMSKLKIIIFRPYLINGRKINYLTFRFFHMNSASGGREKWYAENFFTNLPKNASSIVVIFEQYFSEQYLFFLSWNKKFSSFNIISRLILIFFFNVFVNSFSTFLAH